MYLTFQITAPSKTQKIPNTFLCLHDPSTGRCDEVFYLPSHLPAPKYGENLSSWFLSLLSASSSTDSAHYFCLSGFDAELCRADTKWSITALKESALFFFRNFVQNLLVLQNFLKSQDGENLQEYINIHLERAAFFFFRKPGLL